MRRTSSATSTVLALLGGVGGAVLLAGVLRALTRLGDTSDATATTLLLVGTGLPLAAVLAWVVLERRPRGLVLEPPAVSLPTPWWEPAVLTVAGADLAGGAAASRPALIIGAALAAVALLSLGVRRKPGSTGPSERAAVVAARRIRDFGDRHAVGDEPTVTGTVEHVGRGATRIVLVGAGGAFGDLVVRSPQTAQRAAQLAGLRVVEAEDRDLGDRLRTGPYQWRRMAGIQLETAAR
jgi:hypothetical protein